jgi:formate-dependent nitrite reductase membrane component NrfD
MIKYLYNIVKGLFKKLINTTKKRNMIRQYISDSINTGKKYFWIIGIYMLGLFIVELLILNYLENLNTLSVFISVIISIIVVILIKIFMIKENLDEIFTGDD